MGYGEVFGTLPGTSIGLPSQAATNPTLATGTVLSKLRGTGTDLDTIITNLATIAAFVDTEVAAIKVKTDTLPTNPGTAIKSVQRGTIDMNGVTSNTATITSVDTAKASLRGLGNTFGAGTDPNLFCMRLVFTNATTITCVVSGAPAAGSVIGFEVMEWY